MRVLEGKKGLSTIFVAVFFSLLWGWGLTRPHSGYRDINSLTQTQWAVKMRNLGNESGWVPVGEVRPESWRAYFEFKFKDSFYFSLDKKKARAYMLHYPPTLTLAMAFMQELFGLAPWAIRLIPISLLIIGLLSFLGLLRKIVDEKTALMSTYFLGAAPVIVTFSQHVDYVPAGLGLGLLTIARWIYYEREGGRRNYVLFQLCWFAALMMGWWGAFIGIFPILYELGRGRGWWLRIIFHGAAPVIFAVIIIVWFSQVGGGVGLEELGHLLTNRSVKNAVQVGQQYLPIPFRLWAYITFYRPFILFNPLLILPAIWGFKFIWKNKRKLRSEFSRVWQNEENRLLLSLLIYGILPIFGFRQLTFVHGYVTAFLCPAFGLALAIMIRDRANRPFFKWWRLAPLPIVLFGLQGVYAFGSYMWVIPLAILVALEGIYRLKPALMPYGLMVLFLFLGLPIQIESQNYLKTDYTERMAAVVEKNTDNETVLLTDIFDQGIWTYATYYTQKPVIYQVDTPEKFEKALKAIPKGYKGEFFTYALPGMATSGQTKLWGHLRKNYPHKNLSGFFAFDLSKRRSTCRLTQNQTPQTIWNNKLALMDLKTEIIKKGDNHFLSYEGTWAAKRPLQTDLVLLVRIPELNRHDHHTPVDGYLRTSDWPGKGSCVKEKRLVNLGKSPLPENISIAMAWCDPERQVCLQEGTELFAKPKLSWTEVSAMQTPGPHRTLTKLKALPTEPKDEFRRLVLAESKDFIKSFSLDPSITWSIESEVLSLQGKDKETYALKSRALNRHHFLMLLEMMIPYALSGHFQGVTLTAAGQASQQGNILGAIRQGAGMGFFLVPGYEAISAMAKGVCEQKVFYLCGYLLKKAAKIKPLAKDEVGFYAYTIGLKELSLDLQKDIPAGPGKNAIHLLSLLDGNKTDLNDFLSRLEAKGELKPTLAIMRKRMPIRELLKVYVDLEYFITKRQLQEDAWYFIDTNQEQSFQTLMAYAQQKFGHGK